MLNRTLFALTAIGTLMLGGAITTISLAQDPGPRPAQSASPKPNLERSMKGAERALKAINQQIDDAALDADTLFQIDQLQRTLAESKCIVPDEVNELSGAEKQAEIASYRARMLKALKTAIALEEALVAADRPAAKAAIQSLADQRKEGHEEYGVDDHDHEGHDHKEGDHKEGDGHKH
jgi:Cytochrome b562